MRRGGSSTSFPQRWAARERSMQRLDFRFCVKERNIFGMESYYTYRSSDAVAGRGSYGHDVRAGYSPWPGVPRGTL